MELVTGGDLFDRIILRGRYSEERARIVMQQARVLTCVFTCVNQYTHVASVCTSVVCDGVS